MGADLAGGIVLRSLPTSRYAVIVVVLGLYWLGARVVGRLAARRRFVAMLTGDQPQQRSEVAELARRAVPIFGPAGARVGPGPRDPFALTATVVVPPLGDGRPGERFAAPGPNLRPDPPILAGSREDAQVVLGRAAALNVVCLGRVGAVNAGYPIRPAQLRADAGWRRLASPVEHSGEGRAVDTAAGRGWQCDLAVGRRLVRDVHVDRGGWAFVVGVTAPVEDAHLTDLLGPVLASWSWIDNGEAATAVDPAWHRTTVDPTAADAEVTAGPSDRPAAWFRAPVPRLPLLPWPGRDGTRDEAHVHLTGSADLLVWSVPLGPHASVRLSASAQPRFGDARRPAGPVVESDTAAGHVLRRRFSLGSLSVHEVQLDHGGRGWTVWLVHGPDEEHLVPVLDRALATWRWAEEPVVRPARGDVRL